MDKRAYPDQIAYKRQANQGLHFSSGTFNSELWVINQLVLIHSENMKRSKVKQYQRFRSVFISYNVNMLCRDNKIKIGGQVNKERNRHARKPPYIHTNTKVFINNCFERIW